MKVKNDHARMITPNGAERLVPFSQIRDWQKRGLAAKLGYSFATPEGAAEYKTWLGEKLEAEAINRGAPPVVSRDPGMAAAAVGGAAPSAGPLGRSGGVATAPEGPISGTGQGQGPKTTHGAPVDVVPGNPVPPAGDKIKGPDPQASGDAGYPGPREAFE